MTQFLLLDAIAVIAGLVALYFVLRMQKRFGKTIKPVFQIFVTTIALLIAAIVATYFITSEQLLSALNTTVMISVLTAIAIGMYLVNKRLQALKISG